MTRPVSSAWAAYAPAAAAAAAFAPAFVLFARHHWTERALYGAYAFAPAALAVMVWGFAGEWRASRSLGGAPDREGLGLGLSLTAAALLAAGRHLGLQYLQGAAAAVAASGLLYLSQPAARANRLLYYAAAILFIVPLPLGVIDQLTAEMRGVAASLAGGMLEAAGFAVRRAGFQILSAGPGPLRGVEVAPECSGLRSLPALLCAASLLTHLRWPGRAAQAAALLFVVPLAVGGNALRVAATFLLVHTTGHAPSASVHAGMGLVSAGLVLAAALGLARGFKAREAL